FNLGKGGWEDSASVRRDGPTAQDIADGISDFTDRTGPFTFGIIDFRQMSTTLEMFQQDEGSELKQSPQLLVLDHEQATIFVGETIRFAETDSASNQSGGVEVGIREAAASPVDTGFQLLIRPHIVPGEDKVILTVIPKAESLSGTGETIPGFDDFTNGVATIQLPRVQSSTLVTKLILGDGQTAVLGGMIEESESDSERKVPILGDIPILGWAFRWKSKLKARNNLMIFLTIRIVRNGSDVKDIYTVYGGKYGGKAYKAMQAEAMSKWNRTKGSGYEAKETATGDR
ncbi:MAG TPA: type II and III secretion system protein, partial [Planctomycetota bacterium]|nr:type II and III secretion system protein [Planctomycetota bacterium]